MVFVFVYMPMDAMNERRSDVCSANAGVISCFRFSQSTLMTPQPGLVWAGAGAWLGPVTVTANGPLWEVPSVKRPS